MSRVYNALTGAARPAGAVMLDAPDDGVWENSEEPVHESDKAESPSFIEIGAPGGPVFSENLKSAPVKRAAVEVKPTPKLEQAREFPRLAPATAPAYLSVRFHQSLPNGAAATGPDGSLVAFHLPDHAVSGEYRTLRDEIKKQLTSTTSRLLHFSAAAAHSGATTVLLNLAITLAAEEKARVIVLDADVSKPATAAKLGVRTSPGLCEVLSGRVPLTLAVQPTAVPRLDLLTAGDPTDVVAIAIAREFQRLGEQLRRWYDWVLVDGGVWGGMPQRDETCANADAVYLVTREAHADRPEFIALRGWVKELGGALRGYVTTKV